MIKKTLDIEWLNFASPEKRFPAYEDILNYKLLNIDWDKQWKTKDDYLNWLEEIVKESQRVLKDNGSFYMFASAEMSWYIESVIRKYFNVLNHIRWADKGSMAKKSNKE